VKGATNRFTPRSEIDQFLASGNFLSSIPITNHINSAWKCLTQVRKNPQEIKKSEESCLYPEIYKFSIIYAHTPGHNKLTDRSPDIAVG
jgi:hypothetical protein